MEDDGPPSPGSYFWPLLGIVTLCGGYLWYSRRKRQDASFELRDVLKYRPPGLGGNEGVRLSIDDLPSRTEFLSNNASTDSLPADVELPVFHSGRANEWADRPKTAGGHPSYTPKATASQSQPSFLDDPTHVQSKAGRVLGLGGGMKSIGKGFGRRSARRKSPIEGGDGSESDTSEAHGEGEGEDTDTGRAGAAVFGIGDDDEGDRS